MKKPHIILPAFLLTAALVLSGCTGKTKTPPVADKDTASESSSDSNSENSTESGEMSSADPSPESTDENSTSSSDECQPYQEIYLDQQYLETLEQDRLYVRVCLYMDDEAIRADYEKKYPELVGTEVYWNYLSRFFSNRGEQLIREFVSDYDIDYEEIPSTFKLGGCFSCNLDKNTISTMLNDTRVAEIIYHIGNSTIVPF
ncbi:MAG: hypothetical protein J1F28_05125 [Oscillospiraceae bacterium]|nr:hypothetical protein [Oscillospiraceae bacterium]